MNRRSILIVQESFQIGEGQIVVVPDFSVPPGKWRNINEEVQIIEPDGRTLTAAAEFNLTHFNIADPTSTVDQKWRVVISVLGLQKDDVPKGAEILVSREAHEALVQGNQKPSNQGFCEGK